MLSKKDVLIQFKLEANTVFPTGVRRKPTESTAERTVRAAKPGRDIAFERHGATLANLPALLANMGHRLVDVFVQNRENKDGKPHSLLTFVFSTEPREIPEPRRRELALHDNAGLMTMLFAETRWSTVIAYCSEDDLVSALLLHGETAFPVKAISVEDEVASQHGLVVTKASLGAAAQAKRDAFFAKKNATA